MADRYRRHTVVLITQTAAMTLAFILAALTLANMVRVWHVMLLAAVQGAVFAFDMPARESLFKELVGLPDLMNAIALNSLIFNLARVVGPAIAGLVVASIGEGWCFLVNGISFIAVIVGLLLMRLPKKEFLTTTEPALESVREGFSYVRRTRTVRDLLMLIGLAGLVGMPFTVLMPIFAAQVLHGGARALGTLLGATGVGALAAALAMALRRNLKNLSAWVAAAATGFGLSLVAFAFSRNFWLSAALLVPVGFFTMLQMIGTNTLLQSMVPDRLRGRMVAAYSMISIGMMPFGAFMAGAIADRLSRVSLAAVRNVLPDPLATALARQMGAPLTVAIGGIACAAGGLVFASRLSGFRVEARAIIRAQMSANEAEAAMLAPVDAVGGPPTTD